MNELHLTPFLASFILFAAGCSADSADDDMEADGEDIADARVALIGDNGLAPNGLAPNGLAPNGLAPNGLAPNGLAPNGLAPNGMAAIQSDSLAGEMSRELVKYTVSCALTTSQTFAFSWTDTAGTVHDEEYQGLFGIAPGWATAPLTDVTEQRLVSACLGARTNWYGVTVMLSMRSKLDPLRTAVHSAELDAYPHVEGAFWGNLFTATPHLNTCYVSANVDLARSENRDCAAGHVDANGQVVPCGMITILGDCSDHCSNLDPHERWFNSCEDPGEPGSPSYSAVVAVALP